MIAATSSAVASGFARPGDSMPKSTAADQFETIEAVCNRSCRDSMLGYCSRENQQPKATCVRPV